MGPVRLRLPEIVQKRAEAHRERRVRIGCRLDDGEDVLVERQMLARAVLLEAERGFELREQRGEDAGVARETQGPGGLAAEQQLRELSHSVRVKTAADAFGGDELNAWSRLAHLAQGVLVRLETELRDEAESPHQPEGILGEAPRAHGPEHAVLQILGAVERVDDLTRRKPLRHRVHGEVAAGHVVLDRDVRVGDDLEVVAAGTGAALRARRRELDPRRGQVPYPAVLRIETRADSAARDLEVLHPAVWFERGAEAVVVDAGDDEVRVFRLEPELLVPYGAADEVRVEAQASHEVLDCAVHG